MVLRVPYSFQPNFGSAIIWINKLSLANSDLRANTLTTFELESDLVSNQQQPKLKKKKKELV